MAFERQAAVSAPLVAACSTRRMRGLCCVRLLLPEPSASPRPRLSPPPSSIVSICRRHERCRRWMLPAVVFGCLLTDFCSADIGACPPCPSRQCFYAASGRHLPSPETKLSSMPWRLRGGFNLARLLIRGPSPVTSNVTPPHYAHIVLGGLYIVHLFHVRWLP
jgi:hypothetical protein